MGFRSFAWAVACLSAGGWTTLVWAQAKPSAAVARDGTVVPEATYERAARFAPLNVTRLTRNLTPRYGWIHGEDQLWYVEKEADGGTRFQVIDADTGRRSAAFDRQAVAKGLSAALRHVITASALPFETFEYTADRRAIEVAIDGKRWRCEVAEPRCVELGGQGPGTVVSPDRKWAAFSRNYNLWIRSLTDGAEFPLTSDGRKHNGYAVAAEDSMRYITDLRTRQPIPPLVIWSPDSRYLLTERVDERRVNKLYLIDAVPPGGSVRPELYTFRYPFPEDKNIAMGQSIIFDIRSRRRIDLKTQRWVASYETTIASGNVWWSSDSSKVYFVDRGRYAKEDTFAVADAATGKTRALLHEISPTFAAMGGIGFPVSVAVLKNGDFIWFAERDGWGHLYYYRANGTMRNRITSGPWLVRSLVKVDERAGKVYFTASGLQKGRNPYQRYLYCEDMNGSQLRLLTPEDADHEEAPPGDDGSDDTDLLSDSGRFFTDVFSTPDTPPTLIIRRIDGALAQTVLRADISKLVTDGWKRPLPFEVMAVDGQTRLYGTMYRPSNFNPDKHYPVLDAIYPGPQMIQPCESFGNLAGILSMPQSFAELGAIVVCVNGRGTPGRSKALWNESYGKMGNAGMLVDHIAGIRQLASRYPYMDIKRVGIYGLSGGGYASTHAVLEYPEFYKVAVSASGDHYQIGYHALWGNTFNGPDPAGYAYANNVRFAGDLQGHLLLIWGGMDDNVPPSQTLRMIDALIKANKEFDMLIIPEQNHFGVGFANPYVFRRAADYFVRYLFGAVAPSWPEKPLWSDGSHAASYLESH